MPNPTAAWVPSLQEKPLPSRFASSHRPPALSQTDPEHVKAGKEGSASLLQCTLHPFNCGRSQIFNQVVHVHLTQ
jgi:hypothetical protein